LKKTRFAYIAGIVDGEGHLTIGKTKRPDNSNGSYSFHYTANVGVTNTYKPLMKLLVELCGGAFYAVKNGGKKPCYKWVLTTNASREKFLLAVLPYLLEKRAQAVLLLKFVRMQNINNPALREAMFQEMQVLHNQKSVETNMLDDVTPPGETLKREPDLTGDCESDPDVSQGAGTTAHIIGCACGFCKTGFTKP
jgi:hypothetical protein